MKKKQIGILIGVFLLLLIFVYAKVAPVWNFISHDIGINPISALISPVQTKQTKDFTTFLLLGIPDEVNYGPNLTDSMTVVFFNTKTNTITTIGVPRDIWRPTIKDKMNAAYAIGENNKEGTGKLLARLELEDLLGKDIHYVAVINFSNFETLIDVLGGVEVTVEQTFTDKKYPIKGKENDECFGDEDYECRYQTVTFKQGKQILNGKTALIYARSRNSEGPEGSDFARSKRQQRLLRSVMEKMSAVAKSGNIKQIKAMYNEVDSLVKRDITNAEAASLTRTILLNGMPTINQLQLPHELFVVPALELYDGRYVLVPKEKNIVKTYVDCVLLTKTPSTCTNSKEE